MRVLCGCGASFTRSGIWKHQRLSHDPRCKEPLHIPIHEPGNGDDDRGEIIFPMEADMMEVVEDKPGEYEGSDGESDYHDEEGDEPTLEPNRFPNLFLSDSNDPEAREDETQPASRLRGGAEAELNNKPYAVKFTGGKAGAVYTDQDCVDGNTEYTLQINNPNNPFSPFSSQIEWEIAHWAKTRGPSSTAFTELMSIEGVSICTQH